MRGKKTLLKQINRRRSSQVQMGSQVSSAGEVGRHGTQSEVHKLMIEKELMMQEVVHLRQEHLMTVQKMDAVNQRVQSAEARQKQMVSFVAKVLQDPVFLGHLKQLKEQREIASSRIRRKFLQQRQRSGRASNRPMGQGIVKCRSGFWDVSASDSVLPEVDGGDSSAALLTVSKKCGSRQFPEDLFQGVVDKLCLDAGGQDPSPPANESLDLKVENLSSSQVDAGFSASDYFISLPDDAASGEMDHADICAEGLVVNSAALGFKGKEVVNLEIEGAASETVVGADYLKTFTVDISQEHMFQNASTPAGDVVSEKGIWNIGLDASSFGDNVWESFDQCYAQETQAEPSAGSCSLWDLGLHNFEEDLDIDMYVRGESSLQKHKDDGGHRNEDCLRA